MNDLKEDLKVEVPDLTGIHFTKAASFLTQLGLKIGNVSIEESKFNSNCIIKQSIPAGTLVDKETIIYLTISCSNPIKYLPAIFQTADQQNNHFLKRFLWIFTQIANSISQKIDNIDTFFNPMYNPYDFFQWIASWFAVDADYSIPEDKIRLLVKEIVSLYQWRGTAAGLAKFLEIVTGYKLSIYEDYRPISEYVVKDDRLVEHFVVDEKNTKSFFTVHFHENINNFDLDMIRKINQIVKSEKPAHTEYYLSFEKDEKSDSGPGFTIGVNEINNNTLK